MAKDKEEKQENVEDKVQIVTPEQFVNARLDNIERKLDELLAIAKED